MIHMKPVLNAQGKPNYLKHNVVELDHDQLPGVFIFL